MLVLTRNAGESIMLGDDIEITVVRSRGGQVQIGIKADEEVIILRKEIWEADKKVSKGDKQ